ncbi:hypothetical protein VCR8J2_240471 [Vibrio coralliirubri]|nr:hypothetical protein VCR8J2_240471 [Vibrio coralliirubri]
MDRDRLNVKKGRGVVDTIKVMMHEIRKVWREHVISFKN